MSADFSDESFVVGYLDDFSYRPGELVRCMASTSAHELLVDVVRLTRGLEDPAFDAGYGPTVATIGQWTVAGSVQRTVCGSYVIARDALRAPGRDVVIGVRVWPTRPRGSFQGMITLLSVDQSPLICLGIDDAGVPLVRDADGETLASGSRPLAARRWYDIRVALSDEATVIHAHALSPLAHEADEDMSEGRGYVPRNARHVLLAAAGLETAGGAPVSPYDGKLERPLVMSSNGIAEWRFESATHDDFIEAVVGDEPHALAVNAPTRAMTGCSWNGQSNDPKSTPELYAATHFHADDIADARWETTAEVNLPLDQPPGLYALRLRDPRSTASDLIPFVIRPRVRTAALALLLPTLSYQAYANKQPPDNPNFPLDPRDHLQLRHPEFGKSLYDVHGDGSGVCLATRARPMLQMRPGYRSWLTGGLRHFSADLLLVEWLERQAIAYDVVCDHDVDDEPGLLGDYGVVVTGSHPEYCTSRLLDALDRHVESGRHLMYLGGNGFYWVTSRSPCNPDLIEVRRYVGTRTWDGEPGERHHATTGELGGLWRDRGRSPNRLTGVGMTAQGWDGAAGYRRTAAASNPRWSWIFEGVSNETFGDFGYCLGGASGDELDRFDVRRGSPEDGTVLATSLPHRPAYHAVVEDVLAVERDLSARVSPHVRSDMVMTERASGGCVFSVGSISFIGSLMWNGGENDVSRITANVLVSFLDRSRIAGGK